MTRTANAKANCETGIIFPTNRHDSTNHMGDVDGAENLRRGTHDTVLRKSSSSRKNDVTAPSMCNPGLLHLSPATLDTAKTAKVNELDPRIEIDADGTPSRSATPIH